MARRFVGPVNILLDGLLVGVALFLALVLRFDGEVPDLFLTNYLKVVPWVSVGPVLALWLFGVHRVIWRYVGIHALLDITRALTLTSVILAATNLILPEVGREQLFPRSVPILFWMIQILMVGGIRLLGRVDPFGARRRFESRISERPGRKRVLVFGAGDVGETLVRDLMRGGAHDWDPIGFVDDDPGKQGRTIHGIRVRGATLDIPRVIRQHRVDEVVIAAPSAPSTLVSSIFRCCQEQGITCKTVPSLADYVVNKSPLSQLREVRIEDLLGREPVEIDGDEVRSLLAGKRVLVTGAGGSIGSELCRQIARFGPERLVALDHDENKLCYVGLELRREHQELDLQVVVGDVKERVDISRVMTTHAPQVIFHAAAHKHVSFMEENPRAAILNNAIGTRIVAEEAIRARVRNFVLISTDKAVNPTNVMGASKRLCEKIVTALSAEPGHETHFNAVRFGNVLGSEGSVIPIFRRQIAGGGPITITHPEARRYFMTIPEASQLVIQAGAFDQSGQVFVLDMGEQVKVLDVARQLIRLSGFEPDRDIPIHFIGLRAGEKLYEELLTDSERTTASIHRKIFIWRSDPETWDALRPRVDELIACLDDTPPREIKDRLAAIVPEYRVEAPVVALDESPRAEKTAPTKVLDDRYTLPPDYRPLHESWAVAGVRRVTRWAVAVPSLAAVGALAAVHLAVAPGAPVFTRESRIGRNRRSGPRRIFASGVPIDRRSRDRRQKNLYGRPFQRLRFNTDAREGATALELRYYAFLRRRGLDLLPAVVHLLTGEMGVVGPPAEHPRVVENGMSEVTDFRRRFTVRPGLTGLSQVLVRGGDAGAYEPRKRVAIDKFYVANRSVGLDVRVLTRTFSVVLTGSNDEPLRLRDRLGTSASSTVSGRLETVHGEKS